MTNSAFPLTRRALIGATAALGACPATLLARTAGGLIAGTYANENGPGLVPLTRGRQGWSAGAPVATIRNASFGVRSAATGVRYLLDEQSRGMLGVYTDGLDKLAAASTLGADPCHAALSADGRRLAVANYSSGSVALFALDRAGRPMGEARLLQHEGSGPDRARQAGPHAHWVGFTAGGSQLHAVDLGADAVFLHRLGAGGAVDTSIAYRTEAGAGPRHLARHPRLPIAYLVTELANTVTVLRAHADGRFTALATLSTLPRDFRGASAGAHIAVNAAGTRLYISNRGHDSIAVFAIQRDGRLALLQHAGCGGHWPRLFLLREADGELLVANERSGNIARLPLGRDGRLGAAAKGVALPGVVFLSA
ncbi:6-phosphogluconolactonase [Sphingomonas sp. S2M10]|uniref:lactonase family protein n=1 Tax=Sphingomonas sp. S2M10 TaxID=2705010 RepID=UPI001456F839|nr:lactonase family protein [Sphingomonas sp. S2M10]NLS26176.1 6-phosphogluconolactonase [Sphingomonas sp. S2M10]